MRSGFAHCKGKSHKTNTTFAWQLIIWQHKGRILAGSWQSYILLYISSCKPFTWDYSNCLNVITRIVSIHHINNLEATRTMLWKHYPDIRGLWWHNPLMQVAGMIMLIVFVSIYDTMVSSISFPWTVIPLSRWMKRNKALSSWMRNRNFSIKSVIKWVRINIGILLCKDDKNIKYCWEIEDSSGNVFVLGSVLLFRL